MLIGFSEGDGLKARLNVLASGFVDLHGHLLEAEPEDGKPPPQPLALRSDRKLFAYVHRDAPAAATGPSKIPIALCDPLEADGVIRHRRLVAPHRWSFRMLEQPIEMSASDVKLGELRPGDAPPLADGELARVFQAFADALPKLDPKPDGET